VLLNKLLLIRFFHPYESGRPSISNAIINLVNTLYLERLRRTYRERGEDRLFRIRVVVSKTSIPITLPRIFLSE